MSIQYPYYKQPRSNEDISKLYSVSKHVGLLDYMEWGEGNLSPSGFYHPLFKHGIRDDVSTGRMRANSSSIELGVGRHIKDVARFANSNNLGLKNTRVGVAYFNSIGFSGQANWSLSSGGLSNLYVNNALVAHKTNTNYLTVRSGHLHGDIARIFLNTSPTYNTSGYLYGDIYLSKFRAVNYDWIFASGNIVTSKGFTFLNASGSFSKYGDLTYSSIHNLIITNKSRIGNIVLKSNSALSGVIDSFDSSKISEGSFVSHAGLHTHDGSNWSDVELVQPVLGLPTQIGSKLYSVNNKQILSFDTLISKNSIQDLQSWKVEYTSESFKFDFSSRVDKANNNYLVAGNNNSIYIINGKLNSLPGNIRAAFLDKKNIVYYDSNTNILTTTDKRFLLVVDGDERSECHKIGSDIYFIFGGTNTMYKIENYGVSSIRLKGKVVASNIWKGEVVYLTDKYELYRHSTESILLGRLPVSAIRKIRRIFGIDSVLFAEIEYGSEIRLYSFSLLYSFKYLSQSDILRGSLSQSSIVFSNKSNIYVQIENFRRNIKTNTSSALNFDAVNGEMISASGHIRARKNAYFGGVLVSAYTKTIPPEEYKTISTDKYLLFPSGTVPSYIDNYLYSGLYSRTYNDITCSVAYKDKYYFGHRGDISIFSRKGSKFSDPAGSNIKNMIPVKFLPTSNKLYALVQDFNNTSVNFTSVVPNAPSREDRNHIPNLPVNWDIPTTKIISKNAINNEWNEEKTFWNEYGYNLVDATVHSDTLYVLAHKAPYVSDANPTGAITCFKYNNTISGVATLYGEEIVLKESIFTEAERGSTKYAFQLNNGSYVVDSDGNYSLVSDSKILTGYNRFHLYSHPHGPFVVHDHVAPLYNNPGVSGVTESASFKVDTKGISRYNYRIIDFSMVDSSWDHFTQRGIFTDSIDSSQRNKIFRKSTKVPFARIVIGKDSDINILHLESDSIKMTELANNSNRYSIRYITSLIHKGKVYPIIQKSTGELDIYKISDFNSFVVHAKTYSSTYNGPIQDDITFGEGSSFVGFPNNWEFISSKSTNYNYSTYADYDNLFHTKVDIRKSLGLSSNVYVLGEEDDVFIQKDLNDRNYRHAKNYSTFQSVVIGNTLYCPLLCRLDHPNGELFNVILSIGYDGTVKLVGNSQPINISPKPVGRAVFLQDKHNIIFSQIDLEKNEPSFVGIEDIKANTIYNDLFEGINITDQSLNDRLNRIYNIFGKKRWFIGEYTLKVKDILNTR